MNKHTQKPGTSGIKRESKFKNRFKKRAQYVANAKNRADTQSAQHFKRK